MAKSLNSALEQMFCKYPNNYFVKYQCTAFKGFLCVLNDCLLPKSCY